MDEPEIPKEIEDIKAADLSPAMIARVAAPKKTWFFQRGDGMIFPCEEREAWDIVYNNSTWKRHDFKLLGCSSGETYVKIVKESIAQAQKLQPEIDELEKEIKKFRRAEDRLIESEAVDMEDLQDPVNAENVKKVNRLRKIIERLENRLDKLEEEYRENVKNVVKRATAAELEVARGNIEYPPDDANVLTPNASPKERRRILKVMNKD